MDRGPLKSFTAGVLTSLLVFDTTDDTTAKALIRNSDYIYPKREVPLHFFQARLPYLHACIIQNGQYDYSKPFGQHAVLNWIGTALLGQGKFANHVINPNKSSLFASSIPSCPLELELPKGILAFAGCVVRRQCLRLFLY